MLAAVALIGGGLAWKWHPPAQSTAPAREQVKWATIIPDTKPLATPPPLETPPEQKTTEPKQVLEAAPELAEAKPQPLAVVDEPPAPAMGGKIKGDGPLAGDGVGIVGGRSGGKRGGSPFAGLSAQIQGRIEAALRQDKRTRDGAYQEKVKLWLDAEGVVLRAESSEGDKSGASAVLLGVKILDRTPAGLPMPIQTSINSVRPR
jgi:hypothetical protein